MPDTVSPPSEWPSTARIAWTVPVHNNLHYDRNLGIDFIGLCNVKRILHFGTEEEMAEYSDAYESRLEKPEAVATLIKEIKAGRTVFLLPPTQKTYRDWPRIVPSELRYKLSRSSASWEDLYKAHLDRLSANQWEAIWADQWEDELAGLEWERRSADPTNKAVFYAMREWWRCRERMRDRMRDSLGP
ncbi:hypothetical protein JCM8097_005542 [Rhodosporidiobolus ruineniae]